MNRLRLRWMLLGAFCSLQMLAIAQYQLVLEKPGAFKRIRIYVGDEIGIRVKGMDDMYMGELRGLKSQQIFMFGDSLDPATFDRIYLRRPRGWTNMTRGALVMASIVYPLMMVLNLPHDQWTWRKAAITAGVSVTALVVQRALKFLYWKRVRLTNPKWRLRIIPTVESLETS